MQYCRLVVSKYFSALRVRTYFNVVPVLLALGTVAACGPGGSTPQLKSTLATGTVSVQNPTGGMVDFVVSDSTGKSTPLVLAPNTQMEVRVATGDVSITGTPRHNAAPPSTQRLTISSGRNTPLVFTSGAGVLPTSIQATIGTGLADHGTFECQNGATAALQTVARLGQTYFTFTCEEPRTAVPHTLTASFASNTVINNLPPDPVRSCLQKFENFTGSRTQNYFRIRFSAYSMECQASQSQASAAVEGSFIFGGAYGKGSANAGSSSGLLTSLAPLVSQFGAATTYGQLVYEFDELSWDSGDPKAVASGFANDLTVQYGGQKTNILFRYQFPTDEYADGVWNFKLQMSLFNNSSGIALDPCANWDKPNGLLQTYDVDFGNAATSIAGGLWQQKFYQFFDGNLPGNTTLYLRMVPLDITGACAGGPSNWVSMNVINSGSVPSPLADALAKAQAAAAAAAAKNPYVISIDGYTPPVLGADDGNRHMIITKSDNDKGWPQGCGYTLPNPPPSAPWYVQLYSSVTSIWDWVAQAYANIKNLAIDVAAGILNTLVPGICDGATCKAALMAGLDAGLTALGVPPNIPNSAMLTDAANGYVSATLADAASEQTDGDIPPDAFKPVTDKVTEQLNIAQAAPSTDKYDWGTWGITDPFYKDRPAILWVKVARDADPSKVPTGYESIGFYESSNNSDPGQPRIFKPKGGIRIPKSIPPGTSILIPIVLEPALVVTNDTQLVSQNIANAQYRWWTQAYKMGNGSLWIDMGKSGQLQIPAGTVYGSGTKGVMSPAPACP